MSAQSTARPGDGLDPLAPLNEALPLLDPHRSSRFAWLSRCFALLLLVAIIVQAMQLDARAVTAVAPNNMRFWFAFAGLYLALPIADWIIFRGLWRLPLAGILPILRKRVANELLFDYSGEAWFYFWARQRTAHAEGAFGAIKDVNLLSALASNLWTLILLIVAFPFITSLSDGDYVVPALLSAGIAVALSLALLLFRRRLLTLPLRSCGRIFGIHVVRILLTTLLLGLVWHLALFDVPVGTWITLAALRLLVMRLPMLPAKDLLFTGIVMMLMGSDDAISALVALTAGLTLSTHIVIGAGLWLKEVLDPGDADQVAAR